MDATTTLVKLLTLCLVFTLSEAPVLALCLYKMPPHDGRRTTDQFQAYVPVVFENDGQYYGESYRFCGRAHSLRGWTHGTPEYVCAGGA